MQTSNNNPATSDPSTTNITTTTVTTGSGSGLYLKNTAFSSTVIGPLPSTKPHGPSSDPCRNAVSQVQLEDSMLSFHDLCFIERLGGGDIGTVYLVELKGNRGCMFAAKVMDKQELVSRNKESRSNVEKEILGMLNRPFLPTLYTTLESAKWSCLLTEFCPGGDLHILRQRQPERRLGEAAVRFYASEVVAALEYLHMMGIIYRDLKPENVLVRSDGHIMLTDFDLSLKCDNSTSTAHLVYDFHSLDTSQIIEEDYPIKTPQISTSSSCILPICITPAVSCFHPIRRQRRRPPPPHHGSLKIVAEPTDTRSMSFVGTYEYLAPEIVSGEGHGNAVDWWTLGILMFELFYGVTPFRGMDHEHTMANIVARALEFPKEPAIPTTAKDLITQLLIKDPTKRMGSTMGATAIKNHPFFNGVNWALLRCTMPPYLPKPLNTKDFISSYHNTCDDDDDDPVEYF